MLELFLFLHIFLHCEDDPGINIWAFPIALQDAAPQL